MTTNTNIDMVQLAKETKEYPVVIAMTNKLDTSDIPISNINLLEVVVRNKMQ